MNIIWKLAKNLLLCISIVITTSCTILATPTPEVITNVVRETIIVKETVIVTTTPVPPTSTSEPNIILIDDFSNEDSGWSTSSTDFSDKFYEDEMFNIVLRNELSSSWSSHPELQNFSNFVADVDIKETKSGEGGGIIGVMFRFQDKDNYNLFGIRTDGYYFFLQKIDGELDTIGGPSRADHINIGKEGNHIQIIAEGSKFSLSVNGELTVFLYDDTFSRGDINLYAISIGDYIDATFDNLVVTRLN